MGKNKGNYGAKKASRWKQLHEARKKRWSRGKATTETVQQVNEDVESGKTVGENVDQREETVTPPTTMGEAMIPQVNRSDEVAVVSHPPTMAESIIPPRNTSKPLAETANKFVVVGFVMGVVGIAVQAVNQVAKKTTPNKNKKVMMTQKI